MRDGKLTPQDIIVLNERVVLPHSEVPEDIRYATYYNKDCYAINAALFEEDCKHMFEQHGHTNNDAIMVFSDKLKIRNSARKCLTEQLSSVLGNMWGRRHQIGTIKRANGSCSMLVSQL